MTLELGGHNSDEVKQTYIRKIKEPMSPLRRLCLILAMAILWTAVPPPLNGRLMAAPLPAYDPLSVPPDFSATTLELTISDTNRKRTIPLRIYLGPRKALSPLLLFSHGLGGSRKNNEFLGQHWAARNYVCVFLQHPGSDEAVWQGKPRAEILSAMKRAASGENFQLRVQDVRVVLDQLEKWNQEVGHALHQRINLNLVGMSGHSFGAVTTQAVSGQSFPIVGQAFTDTRIKAACLFSPSGPAARGTQTEAAKQAFGAVKIPWLIMTGTKDTSPRLGVDVASRLAVFPALPAGGKYEVVLEGAQHSAFSARALPGEEGLREANTMRNPNHHRVMLAVTTAYWDAWLQGDEAARNWLDGQGPSSVLEKGDRWSKK